MVLVDDVLDSFKAGHHVEGRADEGEILRHVGANEVVACVVDVRAGGVMPPLPECVDDKPIAGRHVEDAHSQYQYFMEIVPTTYVPLRGREVTTNQYSVTEHVKLVEAGSGRGLPGVYFFYQVSPISAKIEENRKGWLAFFTSMCAIVGGIYTVLGVVDSFISVALESTQRGLGL